jgi:hypothetical protein
MPICNTVLEFYRTRFPNKDSKTGKTDMWPSQVQYSWSVWQRCSTRGAVLVVQCGSGAVQDLKLECPLLTPPPVHTPTPFIHQFILSLPFLSFFLQKHHSYQPYHSHHPHHPLTPSLLFLPSTPSPHTIPSHHPSLPPPLAGPGNQPMPRPHLPLPVRHQPLHRRVGPACRYCTHYCTHYCTPDCPHSWSHSGTHYGTLYWTLYCTLYCTLYGTHYCTLYCTLYCTHYCTLTTTGFCSADEASGPPSHAFHH